MCKILQIFKMDSELRGRTIISGSKWPIYSKPDISLVKTIKLSLMYLLAPFNKLNFLKKVFTVDTELWSQPFSGPMPK